MGSFYGRRAVTLITAHKAMTNMRAPIGNRTQIALFALLTLISDRAFRLGRVAPGSPTPLS